MEKYYVAQLDDLSQRNSINKLVEVRFSRRPSTFGVLYVTGTRRGDCTIEGGGGGGGVPRRLSTADEGTARGSHANWLGLATLSLTLDNKAKFMIVKEAQLVPSLEEQKQSQRQKQQQPSSSHMDSNVADFDTISSGQLLIEGSSSSSTSQTLQSSVFVLTRDGRLMIVSMIDCTLRELRGFGTNHKPRMLSPPLGPIGSGCSQSPERFVQVEVCRQGDAKNDLAVAPTVSSNGALSSPTLNVIALSDRCLYSYAVTLNQAQTASNNIFQDCVVHLNYQYSIDQCQSDGSASSLESQTSGLDNKTESTAATTTTTTTANRKRAKFTRMTAVRSDGVILLELSDGSLRILRRARCLASLPTLGQNVATSLLLPSAGSDGEPNMLLMLTLSNQLVAHSLVIGQELDAERFKDLAMHPGREADHEKEEELFECPAPGMDIQNDRDPDGLLLEEPSFELEPCWSIDLNQIDGVRPMFDEDEDEEGDNEWEWSKNSDGQRSPYLCLPIWPASDPTTSTKKVSHATVDSEEDIISHGMKTWPRFLFVICKHHVLVFSFEHANVLPFSVIYDRAFLNLTSSTLEKPQATSSTKTTQVASSELQDKRIDLRLKPKLLHNIKLIGTRANDSLFNMLFLTCRIHLVQAKNFNHLGFLVAISNLGHVFVFKLTSAKLLGHNHKDNLYQQLLIDSLRDSSLLQDELNRMRNIEVKLKELINGLEMQVASGSGQEDSAVAQERIRTGSYIKPEQSQQMADVLETKIILEPHESISGLYDLIINWPSLMLTVTKVIIVSTVDGSSLRAPLQQNDQVDSMIMRPKIRRALIINSEQIEIDKLFQDSSGDVEETCPTAKARALIELDPRTTDQVEDGHMMEGCFQRGQLNVPIFLDEFKVGQLKIYLICYLPFADIISSLGHHPVPRTNHTAQHIVNKFIKRKMYIKPLNSYRFVPNTEGPLKQNENTVSFCGSFSVEKAISWLDGLLDVTNMLHRPINHNKMVMTFRSNSRLCTLRVEISTNNLSFAIDDPKAFELIKQIILKEATNDSIQLKPQNNR